MTENTEKGCCGSKMLCPNIGTADRAVRAIVGLILISLVFVGPQTPLGWLGIIPLATAAIGWCGAYTLFGINTKNCCASKKSEDKASGGSCCGGHCHSGDKPAA